MGFILRGSTAKKRSRKDTAEATTRSNTNGIMFPAPNMSISSNNSILESSISSSGGDGGGGGEWSDEGFITRTMPLTITTTGVAPAASRRNSRHSKSTTPLDAIIAGQHPSKVKMRSPKSQLEFDAFLSHHSDSKDSLDNLSGIINHTSGGFLSVHDFPSFDISERGTAVTNTSSIPTHKAGNVSLCDSISLVLTAMICLSVLQPSEGQASVERHMSFAHRLLANPERIVRESILRYTSFHLNQHEHKDPDDSSLSSASVQVSAKSLRHLTPDKAHIMVRQSLAQRNFKGAILIYEALLAKQPLDGTADTYERASTLTKLGFLCLSVGQNSEALAYSMQAMQLHQDHDRQLQAAWTEMQIGLIHFGSNKVTKAQKSWREAMQRICATCGYDNNMHVAVLLCNIGVLHYESGDVISCIRSLEESIELQRKVMSASAMHIDTALFQLATTMGNLAMACERRYEYDKAMALLEESLTLLESIDSTDTSVYQQRVEDTLQRLAENSSQFAKKERLPSNGLGATGELLGKNPNDDVYHGNNDDDDQSDAESIDSVRSAQLFGNSDGIPSRRATARLSLEIADNHDFILLGRLHPEMSAQERVNETVLSWFGKRVDKSVPFVAFDATYPVQPRYKESIKVDIDEQHVLNAELHLKELHSQAMEHLDHDEVEDALDIFRSALRSHRDKYGEMHHLVGSAWHNIGMIHLYAKQYGPAHVAFLEAVKVRTAALGSNHPDVQNSMMKIGMIHLATSDLPKARNTFWDIRDKFLEVLGYGHPQLAKIVNNIGIVCYECGDLYGANRSFEIAYEYQIRLREEVGEDNAVVDLAIANTLSNIAFLYVKAGELVHALRLFEEALDMRTKYLESKDPHLAFLEENIQFLLGRTQDSQCDGEGCMVRPGMCLMSLF